MNDVLYKNLNNCSEYFEIISGNQTYNTDKVDRDWDLKKNTHTSMGKQFTKMNKDKKLHHFQQSFLLEWLRLAFKLYSVEGPASTSSLFSAIDCSEGMLMPSVMRWRLPLDASLMGHRRLWTDLSFALSAMFSCFQLSVELHAWKPSAIHPCRHPQSVFFSLLLDYAVQKLPS